MDSKLRELIEAAIDKTERGGIVWTAFDSDTFRAKIDPGYLHIYRDQARDDANETTSDLYLVQVSDAQGRVVLDDSTGDIDTEDAETFKLVDRLFQTARKSALGSERVLDDMLRTLRGGAYFSSTVSPPTAN